jgi:WD40 repeat protein
LRGEQAVKRHCKALLFGPLAVALVWAVAASGSGPPVKIRIPSRTASSLLPPPPPDAPQALAISPDNKVVVSLTYSGEVVFWDVARRKPQGRIKAAEKGKYSSAAFSPDGKMLAATNGSAITLWDVESRAKKATFMPRSGSITALCFSPGGRDLIVGSARRGVLILRLPGGEVRRTLTTHKGSGCEALAVTRDGALLAAGARWEGIIQLWDLRSGKEKATFTAPTAGISALAFSPDGKLLASGTKGWYGLQGVYGDLTVWDVERGKARNHLLKRTVKSIHAVRFSQDGKSLLSVGSGPGEGDGEVRRWDVATGHLRHALTERQEKDHQLPWARCFAISEDGSFAVFGKAWSPAITVVPLPVMLGEP